MDRPQFPETLPPNAHSTLADIDIPEIPFTPVPRRRNRRDGWSEERQREFIAALARCGSAAAAARHVGKKPRSAYRLLDAPGAEDFARAWDVAADMGLEHLRSDALERSLNGAWIPVYRRGRLVRVEHRRNDRLAIAMLSGRATDIDHYRRSAVTRFEHRRDLREMDGARAERDRKIAEAEQEYRDECNRLVERLWRGPRIRML